MTQFANCLSFATYFAKCIFRIQITFLLLLVIFLQNLQMLLLINFFAIYFPSILFSLQHFQNEEGVRCWMANVIKYNHFFWNLSLGEGVFFFFRYLMFLQLGWDQRIYYLFQFPKYGQLKRSPCQIKYQGLWKCESFDFYHTRV